MADDIPMISNVDTTVTGGDSTTVSTGTKKVHNDVSNEWQNHADNLEAENAQYVAQLKSEGKSFQEIQRDDVYQANKQEIREAKANVESSKDTVETWTTTRDDINGQAVGRPHVTETKIENVNTQPDLTPSTTAPALQQTEISNTQESVVKPHTESAPAGDLIYNDMGELVPRDEMALDDPRWEQPEPVADGRTFINDMGEEVPIEDAALDGSDDYLIEESNPGFLAEQEENANIEAHSTNAESLSEDPNMVWDDDTGEYVPKEDMPENWDNGEPVPPEVDDFGCTSDEVYDDEKGYCVPKFDDFGCTPDEEWDDEAGYCVTKGEEPKQAPPSKPVPKDIYSARRAKANNKALNDWRVRLSLAPQAQYLYNKPGYAGILEPLRETDGVIFPYVPRIDTIYHATYNQYDLTHSNYRGYFYQNSYPGEMLINATFTAQDTKEANYMLAVIHFIRSCTKMFYGQDQGNPHRGSPPPLVFMRGLGEHQFNEHPCVVTLMNYNLPDDVDYIKASVGGSLGADTDPFRMNNETKPIGHQSWSPKISRLWQSGLEPGAEPNSVDDIKIGGGNTMSVRGRHRGDQGVSRVPTKLDISFNLLPIQTRDQVSNQYSMDKYGTGELLKRGFY